MDYKRQDRVAGVIQKTLSRILIEDIMDPRLENVSVTRCELSHDLKYLKVFFSVLQDSPENRMNALSGMKSARGYYKRELGKRCGLRVVPQISFHYDDTVKQSVRMDELFRQIEIERKNKTDRGEE